MQNKTAVRYYFTHICVHTQSVQSCATLCDPPGPSVHGISQERTLQWVTVYSSRGSSRPRDWTMSPAGSLSCEPPGKTSYSTAHHIICFSRVRLFATPWTIQSMGFSRPEFCPFSRGSSRPRNQTGVSCIADGFFTNWAIREASSHMHYKFFLIDHATH